MESRGISKNVIPTKIYGSENEAFFFCLVSWYSRKWFTTAWKSYEAGPFRCYAALAGSAGPSLASGRKIYSSEQRSYIRQTTHSWSPLLKAPKILSFKQRFDLVDYSPKHLLFIGKCQINIWVRFPDRGQVVTFREDIFDLSVPVARKIPNEETFMALAHQEFFYQLLSFPASRFISVQENSYLYLMTNEHTGKRNEFGKARSRNDNNIRSQPHPVKPPYPVVEHKAPLRRRTW